MRVTSCWIQINLNCDDNCMLQGKRRTGRLCVMSDVWCRKPKLRESIHIRKMWKPKTHYNEADCVLKVWSRVKSRPDRAMCNCVGECFNLRSQNSRATFMWSWNKELIDYESALVEESDLHWMWIFKAEVEHRNDMEQSRFDNGEKNKALSRVKLPVSGIFGI